MQAAVLLLFLVGQVIIRMKNDILYLEHNYNKLIFWGKKGILSSKEIQEYAPRIRGLGTYRTQEVYSLKGVDVPTSSLASPSTGRRTPRCFSSLIINPISHGAGQICPSPAQMRMPVKNQWVEILMIFL